ncbi:BUB protein kinase [Kwoniella heveanensis CBS 569]|nr:BUB protein kinase [Kwoniella heveanensis CBS 569]
MESLFSPSQRPPSPTSGPVTDFALIESQKENIRPLATGRSAATLSNMFKEPSATDKVVQEGHERHRKDIEEAERRDKEGEDMVDGVQDVLDVYHQYIAFVVQHHPSSDTHLLPLLETTTRRFVNDARYTQDVRYLKLWSQYARYIERREEIWSFLESRDIGTRHSVFYEEWASALEGLGRRKKADEIYRLGIARKASPIDRLKTRHKQFLERIMAPPSGVVPDDEPSASSSSSRGLGRSVLGHVSHASTSVAGATQLAPSMRVASKGNGSKMEIFSDDTGRPEDAAPGEWADFGTRDGRRKENTVEAGPWKGETLPQSASRPRVAPRTPKVEVFKDVSENEGVRAADEVFTRIRQPPTEAELLKTNPLRHYDISELSTAIPSIPAPPSVRKPPRPAKTSHFVMQPWVCPKEGSEVKSSSGKIERRIFDWDHVYKGDDEWSFEEVRARERGLMGKEWRGEIKDWERAWHVPGSSTPRQEEKKAKPPSPTVNTKLAEAEVMRMFDQTIHGGRVRDSDSDSDDDGSSGEEDEPVQCAPTPLPTRSGNIVMLAPTPGGQVPPTPTPSAHIGQNRLFAPPVISDENNAARPSAPGFTDENAVPPSASKAGKFNVFSETPAKPPAGSRTPLGQSSSKPKAFGVFSDKNAENAIGATPSAETRVHQPLGSGNAFGTPAVARIAGLGRSTNEVIQEVPEADEENQEEQPQGAIQAIQEEANPVNMNNSEGEEEKPRWAMRNFDQINTMTPITERTCEYTHMSNFRSSMTGGSRPLSVAEEGPEEGDSSFISNPAQVGQEPQERHVPARLDFDVSGTPEYDLPSGDANTKFHLPEGFTIHRNANEQEGAIPGMILSEGGETDTMHTAREGSVEPDTDAFVTAAYSAPGGLPNPCNPASEEILTLVLAAIDPPLQALVGFVDNRATISNHLPALQKYAKGRERRGSTTSRASMAPADDLYQLDLQGRRFEVKEKIGEGGFGAVFLAVDVERRQAQDDADSDDEDEDAQDHSQVAIKVEQPGNVWEAVVLDRIYRRVDQALLRSIVRTQNLYSFQDESFLLLDYSSQGTLLDVVNKATAMGIAPSVSGGPSAVDELLAIFFTIELLRLVEGLHGSNFIHGDLKIDNCLIRLDETSSSWSPTYTRNGSGGWSDKGLKIIDFGRAIDLTLYPAGEKQTFVVDWQTDERDCAEMRENRPWSYQTDYFGLAGIAYCMLFGKYMETKQVNGLWKIDQPLRRYWQSTLWDALFDTLLNPGQNLPITPRLTEIRGSFEEWLEDNCQKGGKSLKSMLKKIELAAITRRRG